jgi:hypothetical protein
MKGYTCPWTSADSLEQPKQLNEHEIRTLNVRSLFRADSLKTLAKYSLVGVQEINYCKSGIEPPSDYTFFYRDFERVGCGSGVVI